MRNRDTARSIYRLAAIALLALAWLACGSDESKPTASAPSPAEPMAEAPGATTPDPAMPGEPDPDILVTSEGVPDGYPSDVPVYPGAVAGPAMAVPGLGVFATFESNDAVADVIDHFRSELASSGWSLEEVPDSGLDASKAGRSVEVRARRTDAGKTEIAVNVNES